jgi:hypothetical protein
MRRLAGSHMCEPEDGSQAARPDPAACGGVSRDHATAANRSATFSQATTFQNASM